MINPELAMSDQRQEEKDEEPHHVLLLPVREAFAGHSCLNEIGARTLVAEFFASGLDAEGLSDGAVAESAGDAIVEEVEVTILEFYDLSAIDTNEVVVRRSVDEVRIVIRLAIAEVDLVDEVCFGEQGECSVNGRAGGFGAGGSEAIEELVWSEVLICRKDHIYDFITLSGLAETFLADEDVKTFPDVIFHVIRMRLEQNP